MGEDAAGLQDGFVRKSAMVVQRDHHSHFLPPFGSSRKAVSCLLCNLGIGHHRPCLVLVCWMSKKKKKKVFYDLNERKVQCRTDKVQSSNPPIRPAHFRNALQSKKNKKHNFFSCTCTWRQVSAFLCPCMVMMTESCTPCFFCLTAVFCLLSLIHSTPLSSPFVCARPLIPQANPCVFPSPYLCHRIILFFFLHCCSHNKVRDRERAIRLDRAYFCKRGMERG
ncbi:MAG: hypothetical protein JOS17DRAFT_374589 [Linnemannia elongata]|nr:MAG: hypothetical protein JOS17DRAFT_374589 [Linnemannia elongata]